MRNLQLQALRPYQRWHSSSKDTLAERFHEHRTHRDLSDFPAAESLRSNRAAPARRKRDPAQSQVAAILSRAQPAARSRVVVRRCPAFPGPACAAGSRAEKGQAPPACCFRPFPKEIASYGRRKGTSLTYLAPPARYD